MRTEVSNRPEAVTPFCIRRVYEDLREFVLIIVEALAALEEVGEGLQLLFTAEPSYKRSIDESYDGFQNPKGCSNWFEFCRVHLGIDVKCNKFLARFRSGSVSIGSGFCEATNVFD